MRKLAPMDWSGLDGYETTDAIGQLRHEFYTVPVRPASSLYHVLPAPAPTETSHGLAFLPARITGADIVTGARRVLPVDFDDDRYPVEIGALIREGCRRGFRVHLVAWTDDTTALLFFPRSRLSAQVGLGIAAYRRARKVRERLLLERLREGFV